jgi:DNA-binding MarR family transcriptional regulator
MTFIAESPQTRVGQLAEQMNVSSQFVTIEVGKLTKKNIVEKRPNHADRRSSLLHLTPKGDRLLRELGPLRRRTNDLMFRSLTKDRAKVLQEILDTLLLDGKSTLHELEAPQLRAMKAPSARSQVEDDAATEGAARRGKQIRVS